MAGDPILLDAASALDRKEMTMLYTPDVEVLTPTEQVAAL